jgi:hypothetical protein
MAPVATGNFELGQTSQVEPADGAPSELGATALLDTVQACLHAKSSEWIFLRELRVGTGFRSGAAQRLDAFALNCLAHTSMKRVCYEVKASRADFLSEMKEPLKRRIGLRYSNEFYFVTPVGLLNTSEIPIECGLVEVRLFTDQAANQSSSPPAALSISMQNTVLFVELPYPRHGAKRQVRRGNSLRACCATSKRAYYVHPRSSRTNSAFRLSIDL